MNAKTVLALASLVIATLSAGCVEFGAHGSGQGDCWASQGPQGQSAGCNVDGNGCKAEQGWSGQGGGCRLTG